MEEPRILGNAGLTGRQQIDRIPPGEEMAEEPVEPVVHPAAQVMPPNCMRVSQSPRGETCLDGGGHGSMGPCVGIQPDGTCLLDIVRRAQEQGVKWEFEVRWDELGNQTWQYAGPQLS